MPFIGICIVVLVVVFLICREINNWYWKINERIALQKETNAYLSTACRLLNRIAINTGSDPEETKKILEEMFKKR